MSVLGAGLDAMTPGVRMAELPSKSAVVEGKLVDDASPLVDSTAVAVGAILKVGESRLASEGAGSRALKLTTCKDVAASTLGCTGWTDSTNFGRALWLPPGAALKNKTHKP